MSQGPIDPEVQRHRDDFLREVGRRKLRDRTGAEVREHYARIIDRLIEWSVSRHPEIRLRPRAADQAKQAIVRFCLGESTRVFWSAYPRNGDGAKLIAVQDQTAETPKEVRDWVRAEFDRIRGQEPEKSEILPTLSFRVLEDDAKLTEVLQCLETALARLTRQGAALTS